MKHITHSTDFAFAGETFSLHGEVAIQEPAAAKPFQASPLEFFVDRSTAESARAIIRAEMEGEA